jgi:hypothetical protein
VATLVARNAHEAVVESGGRLESGGRFCVGAFGTNPILVAVKMFSHVIYFINGGSSGSIVSDYVLDDWGSIPDRDREFFF